jgi:TonB family protein
MRFIFRICRLLLLGIVWSFLLLACAAPNRAPAPYRLQGKYSTGIDHYQIDYDAQNRKHGIERWWYAGGNKKSEAIWRTGLRDGAYTAWYADGTLWYAGRDSLGKPVDTLRFWYPNGMRKSVSVFVAGEPVFLETYDVEGLTASERAKRDAEERERLAVAQRRMEAQRRADSLEALEGPRRRALATWSSLVRLKVETYWNLPESQKKVARRTVARIRVAPNGNVLTVTWAEKSGSKEFDRRAAKALAKMKKLPPLPAELGTTPLEIRYAFTTPGKAQPRKKLLLKDPASARED